LRNGVSTQDEDDPVSNYEDQEEPNPNRVRVMGRSLVLPALQPIQLIYMRILSVITMVTGIVHWARIVGYLQWQGSTFLEVPIEWQGVTIYFAVFDLVAAVGLWLGVAWGGVMWIFVALSVIVAHTVFAATFGLREFVIAYYVVNIVIYGSLAQLAKQQRLNAND
jgi:hypothetical protein